MSKKEEELSIRDIISKISKKEIDPTTLSKETRLSCVETLLLEGQQQAAIAQFLKKSDRTIRRDLEEIREGYSIKRDSNKGNDIVSDFMFNSKINTAYLMRLARSSEASIADKVRAEAMAFRIHKEVLQELDYIGLLSFAHTKEVAKIVENVPQVPMTEKDKKVIEGMSTLNGLEKIVFAERLNRGLEGRVDKFRFYSLPNGRAILDSLIQKGVFEDSQSTIKLKRNKGEYISRPQEIAGDNFDSIWDILRVPQVVELDRKDKEEQDALEVKQP